MEDEQLPTATESTKTLACVQCRSKKVKCNKRHPFCSRCAAAELQCQYTKRKPRRRAKNVHSTPRELLPRTIVESASTMILSSSNSDGGDSGYDDEDRILPREANGSFEVRQDPEDLDSGRLFIGHGKHRYINATKAKQVRTLESVLTIGREAYQDHGATQLPTSMKAGSVLLRSAILSFVDLTIVQPPPEDMRQLWKRFQSHVDPLVKLVFKPGIEIMLQQAINNLTLLSTAAHALLLTIWYAAVTATTPEDCQRLYLDERDKLMARYRTGAEQALLQLNWRTTQQTSVLQAVVLLLVFSSGVDSRHLWTISGLAVSIAQAMGLHKDGVAFDLHPVEIEVRRRLWWTLVVVDNRVADDCGLSNHIPASDTALPSNVKDYVLANCTKVPLCDTVFTESTITHLKGMMASTVLKIKSARDAGRPYTGDEVIAMTQSTINAIAEYSAKLDTSSPLEHWCYLLIRLMTLKLVSLQLEYQEVDVATKRDVNLAHTVELLEITYRIPECSFELGWQFNCKSVQWHSMAYVLHDLYDRQQTSSAVQQAVRALCGILDTANSMSANHLAHLHTAEAMLWVKLLDRARIVLGRVDKLPSVESAEHLPAADALDWPSELYQVSWAHTMFDGFESWDYA